MNKFAKIALGIFSLGMVFFAVLGLVKMVGKGTTVYSLADDEMRGFIDTTGARPDGLASMPRSSFQWRISFQLRQLP